MLDSLHRLLPTTAIMRFVLPTFVSLLAAAGTAVADSLDLHYACPAFGSCYPLGSGYWFYNDGVRQSFSGVRLPGCASLGIANMVDFCYDDGYPRAHFQFAWEASKRCLGYDWYEPDDYHCADVVCTGTAHFSEIACYWREGKQADGQPLDLDGSETVRIDEVQVPSNETRRAVPRRAAVAVVNAARHEA